MVHNYVIHGAYDFGNWVNEWNGFWSDRGLLGSGGVDVGRIFSMSPSERTQLASEAKSFSAELLNELEEGIDLGGGVSVSDCVGGAPY